MVWLYDSALTSLHHSGYLISADCWGVGGESARVHVPLSLGAIKGLFGTGVVLAAIRLLRCRCTPFTKGMALRDHCLTRVSVFHYHICIVAL